MPPSAGRVTLTVCTTVAVVATAGEPLCQ